MRVVTSVVMFAVLTVIPLVADGLVTHKFYFSRTIIRPSRMGLSLEIEMRLFTDDLERAIDLEDDLTRLGTADEARDANFRIEDYIRRHFALYINDQFSDYRFFGKDVDFDLTYCYMECTLPRAVNSFEVQNTVLMDVYYEQVNEVDVSVNGIRKRLMLTYDFPSQLLNY